MSWFNERNISAAIAKGISEAQESSFEEQQYNADRWAEALNRNLEGVAQGITSPEVLVVEVFHKVIIVNSVLRHPEVYRNVDMLFWARKVADIPVPRKKSDYGARALDAVTEINQEFLEAGFEVDRLMDERIGYIEFDTAWDRAFDADEMKIQKFGRAFVPQFQTFDDLIEFINQTDFEASYLDETENTYEDLDLFRSGRYAFGYIGGTCPGHGEPHYFFKVLFEVNEHSSLGIFRAFGIDPARHKPLPSIAGDGWEIRFDDFPEAADCGDFDELLDQLKNAIGGEIIPANPWSVAE